MNNEKSEKKKLFGLDFEKSLCSKENLLKRLQNQVFSQVRKFSFNAQQVKHLKP